MDVMKVICIPYAGGSAVAYNKLKSELSGLIEIDAVELSGRGKRFSNSLYTTFEEAVNDIYESIKMKIYEKPYALLGHSLGSWLAYEVYQKIQLEGKRLPEHMFFSGNVIPPDKKREKYYYTLSDAEFIKFVIENAGTPESIFDNEQLRELFLPILRADFKLAETYIRNSNIKLMECDITVFSGDDDNMIDDDLNKWAKLTNKNCNIFRFKGDHFFLFNQVSQVAEIIIRQLDNLN